jgi:predicted ArsR family transcriptional regulator
LIQYIKLNNTKQIQINDSGKGVYHALIWFWKGRKTKITYGELSDKSGVSDHGIRFWIQALANIGVIEIENESSYISFTLKHIERDNVEFFYSGF